MRNAYLQMCDFGSRFRILKGGKISLVVSALLAGSSMSFAAPSGGTLTSGVASINQSGLVTTIKQTTDKASINWQDFSIGKAETVNFIQPSASSVTLNRVIGTTSSLIEGAMNANGQVFLLNPNGVLFADGSQINVGGLVASTLNITDENFQAGNYVFEGNSQNSILNRGTITANNGYVALMGKTVQNEGIITATMGNVQLAGGDKISLNLNGNSLVKLTIDQGTLNALVENKGLIKADGGQVYLTTQAVNTILDGMVNNTGIIEAQSLNSVDGKVVLFAHGGTANVSGTIDATGGFVETSGKNVKIDENLIVNAQNWLIDPVYWIIDSSVSSSLNTNLNNGTSVNVTADKDIAVNSSIVKTRGTEATLTLKAGNSITIADNVSITSSNDKLNLILWADSDAANGGYVQLAQITNNFEQIRTNGGHLWIGGGSGTTTWNGLSVGDGYAKNTSTYGSGVFLGEGSILTNGGNIAIYGEASSTSPSDDNSHSGVYTQTSVINSGTGTISIYGKNSMSASGNVYEAIYINGGTMTSSATTGDAITLHGDSSSSTGTDVRGTGITIHGWFANPVNILANGGGNINIYGKATQTGTSIYNYGVRVANAESSSTSIATTNGGDIIIEGITTHGTYGVGFETAMNTLSSSGNINITSTGSGTLLYGVTAGDIAVTSSGKINLKDNITSNTGGDITISSQNGIELTGYDSGSITTNGGTISLLNGNSAKRATNGIVIGDSANMQTIDAGATGTVLFESYINSTANNAVSIIGRSIDGGDISILGDNSAFISNADKHGIYIDLSYGARIGESAQKITFTGVSNYSAGIYIQGSTHPDPENATTSQIGGIHTGEYVNEDVSTGLFFYTQGYSSETGGTSLSLGSSKPTIVLAEDADVILSAPTATAYSYYGNSAPSEITIDDKGAIGNTGFAITNLNAFTSMISSNTTPYLHFGNTLSDLVFSPNETFTWSHHLALNSKGSFELNNLNIGGNLWMSTVDIDSIIYQSGNNLLISAPTSTVTLKSGKVFLTGLSNLVETTPDSGLFSYNISKANEIYNLKLLSVSDTAGVKALVSTSKDINLEASNTSNLVVLSDKGINISGTLTVDPSSLVILAANSEEGHNVTFSNTGSLVLGANSKYSIYSNSVQASHATKLINGAAPDLTLYETSRDGLMEPIGLTQPIMFHVIVATLLGYQTEDILANKSLIYYTAQPESTPEPINPIDEIVTTIKNQSIVPPQNITPPTSPVMEQHSPLMQIALNTLLPTQNGNDFSLVSTTDGNGFLQLLSMNEIQKSIPVGSEIRVSLGHNSVVELINGGVTLPDGVSQEFYVVKKAK